MAHIERHGTEPVALRRIDKLPAVIDRTLARVSSTPGSLKDVQKTALLLTRLILASDTPNQREAKDALTLSASAGAAFYAAGNRDTGEFEAVVRERIVLPAMGPTIDHDTTTWLESLWGTLIVRQAPWTSELCSTPLATLRAGGGTSPEYVYQWADAVRAFCLREPDALTKITQALKGTDPEQLPPDLHEYALLIDYPQIRVFFHLATQEAEEFNSALVQALEHHREYWSATTERANDPDGVFSLPLTAMVAIAHDVGLPVTVTSEYLLT